MIIFRNYMEFRMVRVEGMKGGGGRWWGGLDYIEYYSLYLKNEVLF